MNNERFCVIALLLSTTGCGIRTREIRREPTPPGSPPASTTLRNVVTVDSVAAVTVNSVVPSEGRYRCVDSQVFGLVSAKTYKVCRTSAADTDFSLIADDVNQWLVVTRQYYVDRHRLERVADSAEARLASRYGRGRRCTPDEWFTGSTVERLREWQVPGGFLRLKVDSTTIPGSRRLPNIAVQLVRQEMDCARWISPFGVM